MMSQEFALKNKNPPCGYYCQGCEFYFSYPAWHCVGICENYYSIWHQKSVHADFCCREMKIKIAKKEGKKR